MKKQCLSLGTLACGVNRHSLGFLGTFRLRRTSLWLGVLRYFVLPGDGCTGSSSSYCSGRYHAQHRTHWPQVPRLGDRRAASGRSALPSPVTIKALGQEARQFGSMTPAIARKMADGGFNLVWCQTVEELDGCSRAGAARAFFSLIPRLRRPEGDLLHLGRPASEGETRCGDRAGEGPSCDVRLLHP